MSTTALDDEGRRELGSLSDQFRTDKAMEPTPPYDPTPDDQPMSRYGFITDAEWLDERLARATRRAARLEIALAGSPIDSDRRREAERQLRFALEEMHAYEQCLQELP
ncbi:MAG TPA: hypothetical protein VFD90_15315 [Gaiellales bacterium]|nr:hypothetical protein [Gaiellales bacterium]